MHRNCAKLLGPQRTSHTIDISSLVNRMDKLDKITITGTAPPIAINPMYRSLDKLTVVMDASHTSAFVSPGKRCICIGFQKHDELTCNKIHVL